MVIKQVKQKRVSELVIEELRRMIQDGELKNGDKLPNQFEFAAQLGVSRNSLREALNKLKMLGAIEQRPRTGTIVKASSPILLADQFELPIIEDMETTLEFIQSRRFIEMGTTELAIANGTNEEIKELAEQVEMMESAIEEEDHAAYVELDLKFHFQIAKASHNRFLANQLLTYNSFISKFMKGFYNVPEVMKRSCSEHRMICEAIRKRELKKAVQAMKQHVMRMEEMTDLPPETIRLFELSLKSGHN